MKYLRMAASNQVGQSQLSARCPFCRHVGLLAPIPHVPNDVSSSNGGVIGLRRCPNDECLAALVMVTEGGTTSIYPAEVIDFDSTNLPQGVVDSLEEAAQCAANQCHRAAAIMIRRTLEAVCEERGATGRTLAERLQGLSSIALLPADLITGLTDLRLLGNDAAHIEAKTYAAVSAEEISVALDVTKAILQAVYQYGALVGRLQALKSQSPSGS